MARQASSGTFVLLSHGAVRQASSDVVVCVWSSLGMVRQAGQGGFCPGVLCRIGVWCGLAGKLRPGRSSLFGLRPGTAGQARSVQERLYVFG